MVNTNIQAPIKLTGPGLVFKDSGDYNPGEYAILSNAEITKDGTLRGRRSFSVIKKADNTPIRTGNSPYSANHMRNDSQFLGEINDQLVAYSRGEHIGIDHAGTNQAQTMWSPSTLPAGEFPVGAFTYNNKHYWITQQNLLNLSPTGSVYIYHCASSIAPYSITFASFTKVTAFNPSTAAGIADFRNYFIHKDRLFIVCGNGIYYSKVTDPTVWSVPDGGFIRLEGKTIQYAYALGNSIFILSNKGIDVFTYSADPNTDAELRPIANMKVLAGCVHRATPYVVTKNALYTVQNGFLDKVVEFSEVITTDVTKMIPMDDSLVIMTYENTTGPYNGSIVYNVESGSMYSMYMRNRDKFDESTTFVDGYTPIYAGVTNQGGSDRTYFLIHNDIDGSLIMGDFYVMWHDRKVLENSLGSDIISDATATGWGYQVIPYAIELRGIVPDGEKYFKKKFKSLILTGRIPKNAVKVRLAFDSYFFNREFNITGADTDPLSSIIVNEPYQVTYWDAVRVIPGAKELLAPSTHRLPMMQRANSFNLRIEALPGWVDTAYNPVFGDGYVGLLELIDLRYFWTHLSTGADKRSKLTNP